MTTNVRALFWHHLYPREIGMTLAARILAIVISSISASSYAANAWHVNAASCVADARAIQDDLYIGTSGTIKFGTGKIGDIVLYCPVSFSLDFTPQRVALLYYDDDHTDGNHVTVQFIKMDAPTGAITVLATADSNRGRVSTGGRADITGASFRGETFDQLRFAYYFRIDIRRTSPTANEVVYTVSLFH
jgi:hypothetical protein